MTARRMHDSIENGFVLVSVLTLREFRLDFFGAFDINSETVYEIFPRFLSADCLGKKNSIKIRAQK